MAAKKLTKRILKRTITIFICAFLCGTLIQLPAERTNAAQATDYLTVAVGYYGMSPNNYVDIATYHWSELEEMLPMYREAYTYYREGGEHGFSVSVDSAYGFALTDLFDLAGINANAGNVRAVHFFTLDIDDGAFASFTWGDLFQPRYYYENLISHIKITEINEDMHHALEWDASEAEEYRVWVEPMLALEENWETFYATVHESSRDNFGAMNSANRFRLNYGMTNAQQDGNQSQSAKMVYKVCLELMGSPRPTGLPSELDMSLGVHTVKFSVNSDNAAESQLLAMLMNFNSSDETSLAIRDTVITPDSVYSDLVNVELTYEVFKEGGADINIIISGDYEDEYIGVVAPEEKPSDPEDPSEEEPPSEEPEQPASEESESNEPEKPSESEEQKDSADNEPSSENSGNEKQSEEMPVPGESNTAAPGTSMQNDRSEGRTDSNGISARNDDKNSADNSKTGTEPVGQSEEKTGEEYTTEAETKMIVLEDNRIAEAVELEGDLVQTVDAEGKQILVVSRDLKNLLSADNPDPVLEDGKQQKMLDEMLVLKLNEEKGFSWKWILLGAVIISGTGALTEIIRYRRIWKT